MNYEPLVTAVTAAGSGMGLAILFGRWALAKTLGDLDEVGKQVKSIREALAAITVRLEIITEHSEVLKDHAKRLAFYEGVDARASRYGGRNI